MIGISLPLSVWLFWSIYLPSIAVGLWKGGAPERIGAGVLIIIPAVQFAGYAFVAAAYDVVDPISLVADCVGVLGFGYLAINAQRVWPICACSFQLLAVSGHFARMLEISGHPVIYSWMKSTPTLIAAMCVLMGAVSQQRRLSKASGGDSWVDWALVRSSTFDRARPREP